MSAHEDDNDDEGSSQHFDQPHPLLASLPLAFWRMRLIVERQAGTLPLKLLILSITAGESEGINPKEIRDRLDLDFSRLTRLIQSLEREGLRRRECIPEDRRFVRLCTTEEGQEFLRERTERINEELSRRLEGRLSAQEIEELDRMLSIVAEGMKAS